MIIFRFIPQTIIIAQMLSNGGEGKGVCVRVHGEVDNVDWKSKDPMNSHSISLVPMRLFGETGGATSEGTGSKY